MNLQYCDLWLIEPNAIRQLQVLSSALTPETAEAARQNLSQSPSRQKSVAILPIHGVLEARGSMLGGMLGMTSMERVGYAFDALVADEAVTGIVLDIASPGGMVYGTPELANKIYSARGTKPILAVANPMAASGAYWIGAAADRLIASPSADVGSVGVIMHRVDISGALEKEGVKETTIRSSGSPFKGEHNAANPMTDEELGNLQVRADRIYDQFTADLAKFRGVSQEHVIEHFGKGRTVDAQSAMKAGMVDRIDTFESTAIKLATGRIRLASMRSEDDWDAPTPEEAFRLRVEHKRAALLADVSDN
jgi:capsid assembly protease